MVACPIRKDDLVKPTVPKLDKVRLRVVDVHGTEVRVRQIEPRPAPPLWVPCDELRQAFAPGRCGVCGGADHARCTPPFDYPEEGARVVARRSIERDGIAVAEGQEGAVVEARPDRRRVVVAFASREGAAGAIVSWAAGTLGDFPGDVELL